MKTKFIDNNDYRSFAKDMIKLCKKYNIQICADDEGTVTLGSASAKYYKDHLFYGFTFTPTKAHLRGEKDIIL